MAVNHHTYCKDHQFQMLVGRISLQLKDGRELKDILTDEYMQRHYGTIDILKAAELVNMVSGGIDMNEVADILGLEYRPASHE